jgi:hypothetical protein
MRDLNEGDEVMAPMQSGQVSWQPVTWFLHKESEVTAEFVELSVNGAAQIAMTKKHLLPLLPCDTDLSAFIGESASSLMTRFAVFAERAKVGQCLVQLSADQQRLTLQPISDVRMVVKQGIYSPMTSSGALLVNDVLSTCYSSSLESFVVQHSFYTQWHWLSQAVQSVSSWFHSHISGDLVPLPLGIKVVDGYWNSL